MVQNHAITKPYIRPAGPPLALVKKPPRMSIEWLLNLLVEGLLEESTVELEAHFPTLATGSTDARAVSHVANIVQLKPNNDMNPNRRWKASLT